MKILNKFKASHRGIILHEAVVSIVVIIILIPILIMGLKLISSSKLYDESIQDEIKKIQLQRILVIAYDVKVENNQLFFKHNNQEKSLRYINNHVILSPGTQIFFEGVQDVEFKIDDNNIIIIFTRNNRVYEKKFVY